MTVIPFPSRRRSALPRDLGEWIDFAAHLIVFGTFVVSVVLFCMVM